MHHPKAVACVVSSLALSLALAAPAAAQKPPGAVKIGKAETTPPVGSAGAAAPVTCAVSAWVADNQTTNHATDVPNPSGVATPKSLTIYFSPGGSSSRVYPVLSSWNTGNGMSSGTSGNPVTVAISADKVTLNIWNAVPLHGAWDASTSVPAWTSYTNGYWRVATCN